MRRIMRPLQPESRDRILKAAIRLFAKKGYNGTSVRDIVKEAGINISMISYYFNGKKGILEEIIRNIHRDFDATMGNETGTMNTDQAIMEKLETVLVFLAERTDEVTILVNEVKRDDEVLYPFKELLQEKLREESRYFSQFGGGSTEDASKIIIVAAEMWLGMIFSGFILNLKDFLKEEYSLDQEELDRIRRESILKITRILLDGKEQIFDKKTD